MAAKGQSQACIKARTISRLAFEVGVGSGLHFIGEGYEEGLCYEAGEDFVLDLG